MVINYLDIFRARGSPAEAQTVLIVYADAVLPLTIATERFQPIARWDTEIFEPGRNLELPQLAACDYLYVHKSLDSSAASKSLRVGALERYDHMKSITQRVSNVKRDYFGNTTSFRVAVLSPELLASFGNLNYDVVEIVLADQDSWDRYEATKWLTMRRWLEANPDDEFAKDVRAKLTSEPGRYAAYTREYLGWGVFALMTR